MPESASERFARAVEGLPVEPDLDDSLRRELAVVKALRELGDSTRLDDVARQRIRRELLAGLEETQTPGAKPSPGPRAKSEPTAVARQEAAARQEASAGPRSRVAGVRGRLLVAAAAALCLLVSLSAMSLLLARNALPGQALYGVKRSAESAELGLTFGAESRGFKHLQFATARLDELEALAGQGADAGRYQTALEDFDADAAAGSRLLVQAATGGAAPHQDAGLLPALGGWAQQQSERLEADLATLPEPAAARTAETRALLDRIAERAGALQGRLACRTVTSGVPDEVGALPAGGPCEPVEAGAPSGPPAGTGQPTTGKPGAAGGLTLGQSVRR